MEYQEFDLPRYDWGVYAFYDVTNRDVEAVMDCLDYIGCKGETRVKALNNILDGELNTGLTFSKNRQTCIVFGRTSDAQNFAHTFTHEIGHCAIHIASEYGIDPYGEELCYIIGDLGAIMLPFASVHLCKHCSCKNKKH